MWIFVACFGKRINTVMIDRGNVMYYRITVMCYRGNVMCYRSTVMCYRGTVMCYRGTVMCHRGTAMCYRGTEMCFSINSLHRVSSKISSAFYLGFARERVKERFLSSDVFAGITLCRCQQNTVPRST